MLGRKQKHILKTSLLTFSITIPLALFLFTSKSNTNKFSNNDEHSVLQIALIQSLKQNVQFPSNGQYLDILSEYYQSNNYNFLWIDQYQPSQNASKLISIIDTCNLEGLFRNQYSIDDLKIISHSLLRSNNYKDIVSNCVEFELLTSQNLLTYLLQQQYGILSTDSLHLLEKDSCNSIINNLFTIATTNKLETLLEELITPTRLVDQLKKRYKQYIKEHTFIVDTTHYLTFSDISDKIIKDQSKQTSSLDNQTDHYQNICKILKAYSQQKQNYILKIDSLLYRQQQLIVNLERAKKLNIKGGSYSIVNIPQFTLTHYNNGIATNFKVIVGAPSTPTLLVTSKINHIVINPKWNVPRSIIKNEMLQRILRDSTFLSRRNYQLLNWNNQPIAYNSVNWNNIDKDYFPFQVQQSSGNHNSLGLIKFLFPNKYDIYLHDTNGRGLFNRTKRALSHGCIRIHNPVKYANLLMESAVKQGFSFEKKISEKETRTYLLKTQHPIYIVYFTCTIENDSIHWIDDIYLKDLKEWEVLACNTIQYR